MVLGNHSVLHRVSKGHIVTGMQARVKSQYCVGSSNDTAS